VSLPDDVIAVGTRLIGEKDDALLDIASSPRWESEGDDVVDPSDDLESTEPDCGYVHSILRIAQYEHAGHASSHWIRR
jgi:hypothetical protein